MAGTLYDLDFGIAGAGGAPGFLQFFRTDTHAALTPPAIAPVGTYGVFEFSLDWTLYPGVPGIFFKVTSDGTVNGIELSGTIPFTGVPTTVAAGPGLLSLSDARTSVLEALKESYSPKGLLPDQATLDRWINRANRWAFKKGVQRNPDAWKIRSTPVAFPASAGYIAQTTLCGATPALIHLVEVLDGSDWKAIDARPSIDRKLSEHPQATTPASNLVPMAWYTEGPNFYFTPPPTQSWSTRVTYRGLLATMAADSDALLAGMYGEHHDLVILKACQYLWHKGEAGKSPWDAEVDDALRDFITALRRSQGTHSRRIRRVSHY